MALKAGRVGVNPNQVDPVDGTIKSSATEGYTKQEADAKFETQEAAALLQPKTLAVPIKYLNGSVLGTFSTVQEALSGSYGEEGAKTNQQLTQDVVDEKIAYTFADDTITVTAGNTRVKRQGHVVSICIDFTMGSNGISGWNDFLTLDFKPSERVPVIVLMYNITDSQYDVAGGGISTQGVLQIGRNLVASKRYQITITTIY